MFRLLLYFFDIEKNYLIIMMVVYTKYNF
uniref:Uncharacterized protein n=1 Tax=Lepeophtheirus salmonis TaxID=72036 RepID=A0A0K2TM84_LEPSM